MVFPAPLKPNYAPPFTACNSGRIPYRSSPSPTVFLSKVWVDLFTEFILLVPLEARVLDVKRTEAQLARDRDRSSRQYPPRWQDVTLRFAAKVLNLSSKSVGTRGHYERLLHERHWTVGHNACKGAKTDTERVSLLTCQLCASGTAVADDTYDQTFRLCQHPLLCQVAESDALLLTVPLLNDLGRRLFRFYYALFKK